MNNFNRIYQLFSLNGFEELEGIFTYHLGIIAKKNHSIFMYNGWFGASWNFNLCPSRLQSIPQLGSIESDFLQQKWSIINLLSHQHHCVLNANSSQPQISFNYHTYCVNVVGDCTENKIEKKTVKTFVAREEKNWYTSLEIFLCVINSQHLGVMSVKTCYFDSLISANMKNWNCFWVPLVSPKLLMWGLHSSSIEQ